MKRQTINLAACVCFFVACTKDKGIVDNGSGYPPDIARILTRQCAVAGCHNAISKDAAAGLSLASWEELFAGGGSGPVVIPFRPDLSTLCFYTNTSADLGPVLAPRMPLGATPLTHEEYSMLSDWIREGAPDKDGRILFSDEPGRSKIYIANRLCDLVMVLDARSRLPMRGVDVGISPKTEFPVCVKTSPDGKHWYVSFMASAVLQRFSAANDEPAGQVDLGPGVWTSFGISADSRLAYCADRSQAGKIACVDLQTMEVLWQYSHPALIYPESLVIDDDVQRLYVGAVNGNYFSVIDLKDPVNPRLTPLVLDGSGMPAPHPGPDPAVLFLSREPAFCFAGCVNSEEIVMIDMRRDSLTGRVALGAAPTSMDLHVATGRLFVTCMNDSMSFPGHTGSVKVLDIHTRQIVKTIRAGYQCSGICLSPAEGYVAVVNSNISPKGPAPHHTGGCAGRNGNVSFINLHTLAMLPARYELAVFPEAAALRP